MTGTISQGLFVPRDYGVFGGLDVDKTSISVTFVNHERKLKSMRIPYDAKNLLGYVNKNFPDQKVAFAYEAGPTGYGLFDDIRAKGYPCLVVAPSMVPTAPGLHVKTNRLDSIKLAEGLRGGQLKSIHVPNPTYRQLRHLVQLRDTCVRQATAAKNRIKALLLFEGIAFPEAPESSQWSKRVVAELKELPCEGKGAVRFKLSQLIANLEFAQGQTKNTVEEIYRFCKGDSDVNRCVGYLTSIPGIGRITASHILARVGDWRELKNVRQLGSFFGLVPRENSTGDAVRRGSITRAADSRLQMKLIQCAWTAIRKDPELQEFYKRLHASHHENYAAKKAIVAVARKLSARIYAVLRGQKNYAIRHEISSALPLNQEKIVRPEGRLDRPQNQENLNSPEDSLLETETPGQLVEEATPQTESPQRQPLDAAHLKTVRRSSNRATNCRESFLGLAAERGDHKGETRGKNRAVEKIKAASLEKKPVTRGALRSASPGRHCGGSRNSETLTTLDTGFHRRDVKSQASKASREPRT